ncbi:MAG: BamA/TamA family outer membrane protein, partial [Myxococcales bacterium]
NATIFTPRFSPDGRFVAFSEHRGANRDVRLLELATGALTAVTSDLALDLNPTFDPSGRYVVFASDRTGIYNLYAFDRQTRRTLQITNTLTGAFRPAVSPDGRLLTFVGYSSRGYDVHTMPFEPERWRDAPAVDLDRPKPVQRGERQLYAVEPYDPLDTLAPQYWLPVLENDPLGPSVGVTTGGADVVGRHSWSAQASLGVASLAPAVDLTYSAHVIYPRLSFNLSSRLGPAPFAPGGLIERQTAFNAFASFPFSRVYNALSLNVGYEARYFAPGEFTGLLGPTEPRPYLPDRGLSSALATSLFFSNAQRFANGISPARGFSLSGTLRVARPELGSDFSFSSVDAAASTYLSMPWLEHHVLALRLGAGTSTGDLGRRRLFALGGIGFRDPLLDAINLGGGRGAVLKGYPRGAFVGNSFVLGNAEYRFPLVLLNEGLFSFPAYLRRVHAAVSFDVGQAADRLTGGGLRPSVGAELRSEVMLGYGFVTDLRLGYARGLADRGINEVFVTLGQGF